jgi:hypothetical protein
MAWKLMMGAPGGSQARVAFADLFHRQQAGQKVGPAAPVRLRNGNAEEAEVTHGPECLGWERFLFVPKSRPGRDLSFDKPGHRVFQHLLFFTQPEIHTELLLARIYSPRFLANAIRV